MIVRNPKFHLPAIKHNFANPLILYYSIQLLNEDTNVSEIADNHLNKISVYLYQY